MPDSTSSTTSRATRKGKRIEPRACAVDIWSSSPTTTAPSAWTKRSRSPSCCSRTSSGRLRRTSTAAILEVAPDYADALHFSGVLAHQQGRSEQAVALIERSLELEPDRADWHSNLGIVLQDRLELDEAIVAYRARDCARSGPCQRAQQSRRRPEGQGRAGRSRSGISSRHSHRSRPLGRLHQPRRPAERPEADARSGHLLLEGHHVEAEASRSAEAAGARALHAR